MHHKSLTFAISYITLPRPFKIVVYRTLILLTAPFKIVVYKILWDYGDELKWPGSTVQVEKEGNTFKRIYIYVGAYKKGGLRLGIGM